MRNRKYMIMLITAMSLAAMVGCSGTIKKDETEKNNTGIETENSNNDVTPTKGIKDSITVPNGKMNDISQEEMATFTEYFAKTENNGFLCSTYDSKEKINLDELFYNGAGIQLEDTDDIKEAYKTQTGATIMDLDFIAITKTQMDTFLQDKMGIGLNDVEKKPEAYIYVEASDAYCKEVGDTNYIMVSCVSGQKDRSGNYVLQFESDSTVEEFECTLKVTMDKAGKILVQSNEITKGSRMGL